MTNFGNHKFFKGLGVASAGEKVSLFFYQPLDPNIYLAESRDGLKFKPSDKAVKLTDNKSRLVSAAFSSDLRFTTLENGNYLTYVYHGKKETVVYLAASADLLNWKTTSNLKGISGPAVIVPGIRFNNKYVLYTGGDNISFLSSIDLLNWNKPDTLFTADRYYNVLDEAKVSPALVINNPGGTLLVYYIYGLANGKRKYAIGTAMLDPKNPGKVIWQSNNAVWEQDNDWPDKIVRPLGVVYFQGKLISYWDVDGEGIFSVVHAPVTHLYAEKRGWTTNILHRIADNPILKPLRDRFWESRATFNPTAVYDRGKVHLIYRAIGDDDVSVLGYATSTDGTHIDDRHPEPLYEPSEQFELSGVRVKTSSPYMSGGGGYGGTEDPRITKIGGRFYLTYVAYNGWAPPRVALTSISEEDFHAKNWRWEKSVLISPPNVVDKNACLFPEKIGGKYVFLHRIFPNILIDFVDDIGSFDGKTYLKGEYKIRPRGTSWDSRKVGAGAPPLKTKYGWLLIYHAVGEAEPGRYKIGAMLLDLKDPTKVIARSRMPILSPDLNYENEGFKAGVVYPCGAVILGDELIVYYGGADMVTCAAKVGLTEFLEKLISEGSSGFAPIHLTASK